MDTSGDRVEFVHGTARPRQVPDLRLPHAGHRQAFPATANTFTASQTINGTLILNGGGSGIQFADGTVQSSAATGGGGIPSGFMILGSSPIAPPGYTLSGGTSTGNVWFSVAPMPTARSNLAAASASGLIYTIGGTNGFDLNTVEVYNPSSNSWSTAAPCPPHEEAWPQ